MGNRFFLALSLIFCSFSILTSCSSVKEGPAIYITNATSGIVKNIEFNWVGQNRLALQSLTPGDSRAKSFMIKRNGDFFGLVTVSWINEDNKKITKNFEFTKDRMPSISSRRVYSYVQVYLMLNDIEVISSDDGDADNRIHAMDAMAHRNREEAQSRGIFAPCIPNRINLYTCPNVPSNALIDSNPIPVQ